MKMHQAKQYLSWKKGEFTKKFELIPVIGLPNIHIKKPTIAYRNNRFLVMIFEEDGGIARLSVIKSELKGFDQGKPTWQDGITWDELQEIKDACGFAEFCAIELYPPKNEIVRDSNMRHLWVLPEPPSVMWRKEATVAFQAKELARKLLEN